MKRLVTRAGALDTAFLAGMFALSLSGLHGTFDGYWFLLAAVVAVLVSVLVTSAVVRCGAPVWGAVVAAAACYLPLALGFVPQLPFDAAVRSPVTQWKDLLTTLPPVDGRGPLILVPIMLGLAGGTLGTVLARLTSPLAPVAVPVLVEIAVILIGTKAPAATLTTTGLLVTALLWTALRAQRNRSSIRRERPSLWRVATGTAILLAVVGVMVSVTPGVDAHRLVLRDKVHVPLDVNQFPSPLAGFRKYTSMPTQNLHDAVLFRVRGLADDSHLRIATLTDYNGTNWAVGGAGTDGADDVFQRIGARIPSQVAGQHVRLDITFDRYEDVWLPSVGDLTAVRFGGTHGAQNGAAFRYDLATRTGIVPGKLDHGATVTIDAVVPAERAITQPGGAVAVTSEQLQLVRTVADDWAGRSTTPTSRVRSIEANLLRGVYSDGLGVGVHVPPGHGAGRVLRFINGTRLVGDDEQYAAVFALVLNYLGYPARVVLGASHIMPGGVVRGSNIHAWVEVHDVNAGWQPIYTDRFVPTQQDGPNTQAPQDLDPNGYAVPLGLPELPPAELNAAANAPTRSTGGRPAVPRRPRADVGISAWVLYSIVSLAVLVVIGGVPIAAKSARRARRRRRGPPATRLAAAWRELVDQGRDLGYPVSGRATRREQANAISTTLLRRLACDVDSFVFGADVPTASDAELCWRRTTEARRALRQNARPAQRWTSWVNLASFRRAQT